MRPAQRILVKVADQNRGLTDVKKEYDTSHNRRNAVTSAHSLTSRPEARISGCPRPLSHRLLQAQGQDYWDWKQGLGRHNVDRFKRQAPHLHEMPGGGRTVRWDRTGKRVQGIRGKTAPSQRKECQVFNTTTNSMGTCLTAKHPGQCATSRLVSCAGTVALLATLSAGCASEPADWATGPRFIDVARARDLTYYYREQALTLSRLADTVEWEALHNADSAEDSRRRAYIQNLRIQAAAAFERAREYRDQLPHNQVY